MNRVFLFEPTQLDISDLERFGEVVYLFHDSESRRPLRDEGLEQQIVHKLHVLQFDPRKDYIGLAGSQLGLIVLTTAVTTFWGSLTFLAFDTISRKYYERRLGAYFEASYCEALVKDFP